MPFTRLIAFGAVAIALAGSTAQAQVDDTKAGVDAFMQGDYERAVRIWRPLAIGGDADAQYNMGQAYRLGRGVAMDMAQAENWYRLAAKQKNQTRARNAYGLLLFQNGRRQEALPYIQESAERGMPQAQYVYATLLFNGDLVAKDWPRSYALMTRASAGGVKAASESLAQLDHYIPLDQRQRGIELARAVDTAGGKPVMEADASTRIAPTKPIRTVAIPQSQPGSLPERPAVALHTGQKPVSPTKPIEPRVAAAQPAPAIVTAAAVAPKAVPAPIALAAVETPEPAPVTPRTISKPPVQRASAEPAPKAIKVKPATVPPVVAAVAAKPKQAGAPAKIAKAAPVAVGGNWRVQLGAFSIPTNAPLMWGKLRGSVTALSPYQSIISKSGAYTRLQAGPLPDRAAAERLCAAIKAKGNECYAVPS